jgi:hypothetical protein
MTKSEDPLQQMMAGMAAGDAAFLFAFVDTFGPKVRWVVRGILEGMGRHDLIRARDELDGLTLDACEVIFGRASGWRPGGAMPWNWAFKAIRAEVARSIGHRTVEFDTADPHGDTNLEGEAGSRSDVAVADLAGDDLGVLIARHPLVRLLDQAIRAVGSAAHQEIYWEYRIQQGLGDPSPANTVGKRFDKRPATVRQICKRHGDRVWALVRDDQRFVDLHDHGWFAA